MENSNDIGKKIAQRLKGAEFTPDNAVWDKIEATLDRKKRRKRFFLFYTLGALGLLALLIGFSNKFDNDEKPSEQEKPIMTATDTENHDGINKNKDSNVDTSENSVISEEISSEEDLKNRIEDSEKEIPQKKLSRKVKAGEVLDSFSQSSTTYYYFRSEDNREVITEDKEVIDSLMNAVDKDIQKNMKRKDSI